jgi:hypothetical protein
MVNKGNSTVERPIRDESLSPSAKMGADITNGASGNTPAKRNNPFGASNSVSKAPVFGASGYVVAEGAGFFDEVSGH